MCFVLFSATQVSVFVYPPSRRKGDSKCLSIVVTWITRGHASLSVLDSRICRAGKENFGPIVNGGGIVRIITNEASAQAARDQALDQMFQTFSLNPPNSPMTQTYYESHFTDEEREVRRGEVASPQSDGKQPAVWTSIQISDPKIASDILYQQLYICSYNLGCIQ